MTIIEVMTGRARRFTFVYASRIKEHLHTIERKYHSLIRRTIAEQLSFDPDVETKNRKPLQEPFTFNATWEIRFGPNNRFRVYYDVNREKYEVDILAIGVKIRNRLFIGREEINL